MSASEKKVDYLSRGSISDCCFSLQLETENHTTTGFSFDTGESRERYTINHNYVVTLDEVYLERERRGYRQTTIKLYLSAENRQQLRAVLRKYKAWKKKATEINVHPSGKSLAAIRTFALLVPAFW